MKICTSEQINCVTFFYTKSVPSTHSKILKVDVFPIAGNDIKSRTTKENDAVSGTTTNFRTILVQVFVCQPREIELSDWFMILN